jgi:hypothetical protein
MSYEPAVRDYLLLGLRMGRLVNGFVDCWFGDPALRRQVDNEPRPDPTRLIADAVGLRAALAGSGLAEPRRRFLDAQVRAIECNARRLIGAPITFGHEVELCFDVTIEAGDPGRYAAVHDEIDQLLPGPGDCRSKVEAFYDRNTIPPDKLLVAIEAVSAALRDIVRPLFDLPDTERIEYRVERDRPWNAFNTYHGDFRSTVRLNDTAGRSIAALPLLVTHESYPGHHVEHCLKEAELVRRRGEHEHVITLINTPGCLISEGTAEHGVGTALGPGWGEWTATLLAEHGIHTDGALVERLTALVRQLLTARQDAAILLHDRHAEPEAVVRYLQRWLLLPEDRARHVVAFLTDPLWRAYSVTYIEGAELVGRWLAARPAGTDVTDRYRRLLTEPLLPSQLREDLLAVKAT